MVLRAFLVNPNPHSSALIGGPWDSLRPGKAGSSIFERSANPAAKRDGLIIVAEFRPKPLVVGNKNQKFEIFFIPYHIRTYNDNSVYNFVEFRLKRACWANYRGATFLFRRNPAAKRVGLIISMWL